MKNFTVAIYDHSSALQTFAISFTKDPEDANDLVQDTFFKAIRFESKFREGTNLRGWLFTIMKNTFINDYRSRDRKRAIVETREEISSAQLIISASLNNASNSFINQDILKALSKLDSNYYIPFIRFFEGYKYNEIAEELNIPIGTVKTRIHMARQVLKKSLKVYSNTSTAVVN